MKKNKIATKLMLGFCFIALLMFMAGFVVVRISQSAIEKTIGENAAVIAQDAMDMIDTLLYLRAEEIAVQFEDTFIKKKLLESNEQFRQMPDRESFIAQKDQEWVSANKEEITPFMQEILDSPLSEKLRTLISSLDKKYDGQVFEEIFVTNMFGVNIAQSNKTTDYYQADELWWEKAKQEQVYFEDIKLDEISGVMSISMSSRIDDVNGQFLGIKKVVFKIQGVQEIVREVARKFQNQTIHIDLLTHEGNIIYSIKDRTPIKEHSQQLIALLQEPDHTLWVAGEANTKFYAHAHSKGYRKFPGSGWIVLMEYDAKEILAQMAQIKKIFLGSSLIFAFFSVLFGVFIAVSMTRPLSDLKNVFKQVGEGNLGTKANISTGDEIEDLSNSFNQMVTRLQKTSFSKDHFKIIVDSLTEILVVINPNGEITIVNQTILNNLGYTESDLIGQDISMIFSDKEDAPLTGEKLADVINHGVLLSYETSLRSKTGGKLPVEISGTIMKDSDGKLINIVCIAKDISEQRRSEEQLRKLSIIADQSPAAIVVTDMEGKIEYVNPAFVAVTGYSFEEAMGKNPRILSSGKNPRQLYVDLWGTIKSGRIWRGEFQNKRKNGELFWEWCSISSIKNKQGEITHFMAIKEDITERKTTEEKLRNANEVLLADDRALKNIMSDLKRNNEDLKNMQEQLIQSEKLSSLGRLAAGVAHEINNPLGFIDNNISVLQEYIGSYAEILQAVNGLKKAIQDKDIDRALLLVEEMNQLEAKVNLEYISSDIEKLILQSKSGTERIKKIVKDLRTFARKDEGHVELRNIEEVIDEVITIVWNEIKYKAELKKAYGGIPQVRCNAQKMGQVFINLLVNAVQAISDKGEITIKTYIKGAYACIEMTDTGSGIRSEDLKNIFDPFFTTKEVGKGTGLGLSIVYDIVKQHKGEIEVASEVGKGTTFTVKLPI